MAPRPHVLVIGGGIAGLTLAGALDPARWRVTVVEGQPQRAAFGTGLLLWPSAQRALVRLGHGPALAGLTCDAGGVTLRSADGTLLAHHEGGAPRPRLVGRPDLLGLLDDAVPAEVARRTEEVVDPFALAHELGADLVVGADGVRSAVRRATWPGTDPRDTGWVALRGVLDGETATTTEYWGPGQLFGITPHPHGTNWFAAFRSDGPGGGDPAALLADTRDRFEGWAPEIGDVLARVTPRTAGAQRLVVTPPKPRIAATRAGRRVVLVGDAAHAMTPNLGRGACEAVVDAAVLARALDRYGPLRGVAAYERRRLLPGQLLRLAATPALHVATTTRLAFLRDRVLQAGPGRRDTRSTR